MDDFRHSEPFLPRPLMKRLFNQQFTLRKVTWVKADTRLGASYRSTTDYTIDGSIQPIAIEAVTITLAGEQDLAVAIGYFRDIYYLEGEEIKVESDDVIIDDADEEWKVLATIRQFDGRRSGYRVCSLQKLRT